MVRCLAGSKLIEAYHDYHNGASESCVGGMHIIGVMAP